MDGRKVWANNSSIINSSISINSVEENTKEESFVSKKTVFKKPDLEEVKKFCIDECVKKGSDVYYGNIEIEAEKIYNHYEAVGWIYGKARTPIKDWKAAVRGCLLRGASGSATKTPENKPNKPDYNKMTKDEIMNLAMEKMNPKGHIGYILEAIRMSNIEIVDGNHYYNLILKFSEREDCQKRNYR